MTIAIATPIVETVPLRLDDSGTLRVGNTRVTLDVVVGVYTRGETAEYIAENFDTLELADVHAVIAYYLRHRDEVDAYLAERDARAEEARRGFEAVHGAPPTRAQLLARLAERRAAS